MHIFMKNSEPLLPFYEFIATNVSVGIHAVDLSGKTIIYNTKMKEIEGFHFDELADRSIIEMFSFRQHESTLMRVLQTGKKKLMLNNPTGIKMAMKLQQSMILFHFLLKVN